MTTASGTSSRPVPSRTIAADDPVPGAKNVVLVMSGKGGVGKSTVASNLALALKRLGYRVGLLDADMYGPSLPTMLGIHGRPASKDGKLEPLERFGVKLMSLGFLLDDPKAAVIWRGPMLHGALMQFLGDVSWGELDFLLLDLPPGTGDVALTIAQKLRVSGSVVVTTPQEVALQDVYKSVSMNKKVGIPITGVVENASIFVCDGCGKSHHLYGEGGGAELAKFAGAPLLAQIPIDPEIRKWGDQGVPVVEAAPTSPAGKAFLLLAERFLETLETGGEPEGDNLVIDRSGGTNRHLPVAR
jgi:ATP-binding protein involved in chromosome partitioning